MEAAIDAVVRQAKERGATRVHRIVLRIGTLAGVDAESLRFAFDAVADGTLVAGAELAIEAVPARAHCAACDELFAIEGGYIFSCPRCHRLSGDVRQGRELELTRIELS